MGGYTKMDLTGRREMDWNYLAEDMDKTDRMNRMNGRKEGWIDGWMDGG